MNRILISLGAVVLLSTAAFSQTYPDVPTGHWAYDAITELTNDGIVKGYPDGTYKGNRNLTRYEFALAIRDALSTVKTRIAALEAAANKPAVAPTVINKVETVTDPKVTAELTKLAADSAKLQKLATEFQDELAALGVDVEALKKDNSDLQKRVAAIEAAMAKLKISADLDFIVRGTQSFSNRTTADLNGVETYAGGLLSNVDVLHNLALNLDAKLSDTATGSATLLISNYLPYLEGSASQFGGYNSSPNTDIVIWKAAANLPISVFGKAIDVTVGRYENQVSPLILKRVDNDAYVNIAAFDNGNYSMDGAKLATSFGPVSLGMFAGKNNTVTSNNGDNFMSMMLNTSIIGSTPAPVVELDQTAGVTMGLNFGENISLSAAYVASGYSTPVLGGGVDNRLETFGGSLKANNLFGAVDVYADFAQSNLNKNDVQKMNSKNYAILAGASYAINDSLGLKAGYREVQPDFVAAGDWGRMGRWINPTGLKGVDAAINWNAGKLGLNVNGGWYEGIRPMLTPSTNLTHVDAKLSYAVNENLNLGLDYDTVVWKLADSDKKPSEALITLSSNLNLAENTALRLMYQVIDVRTSTASYVGAANSTSGVAVAQLSVKF